MLRRSGEARSTRWWLRRERQPGLYAAQRGGASTASSSNRCRKAHWSSRLPATSLFQRLLAALAGQTLESIVGSGFDRFVTSADKGAVALMGAGSGRLCCSADRTRSDPFDVSLSLTTRRGLAGDCLNLIVTDRRDPRRPTATASVPSRTPRERRILAVLAHELRTPERHQQRGARPRTGAARCHRARRKSAQEVIARQVGHISRLIDDLLDVESVVSEISGCSGSRSTWPRCSARRSPVCQQQQVGLALDITAEPVWVHWDAVRLRQC